MDYLADHTTTTARDRLAGAEVALLPTGATEQHGPALPLSTDFRAAETVAGRIDRDDTVRLPTIPVGVSDHHRQFHGTLSVTPETFEDYVGETVASLADHGVRKVVLVNGHGGNSDALRRAARRLRRQEVAFAVPWNWWANLDDLTRELFGEDGIGHADATETSMVYAVAEDLVREDALAAAEAGAADSWGKSVHGGEVGFDTADFSDSGAVGHPTEASREAGERLLASATDDLDALLDWLADQPFADLLPQDHR
ncbi:creatininase family protein [Salinirubrum litoreum]|uniref:Creatininase family protein n=1 Tax=Salinirubrum litoreum TaxID=1126234 RepID=A0ABD5RAX9_9EURY|nr:creatininase family protein [Salinirubrum litoreum]